MDSKKPLPMTMTASRRAFFRVTPSLPFTIETGEGKRSVLPDFEGIDVSVYGLGFLVEDPEAQLLIPGLILKGLRFQLEGRTIAADGRIQHRQLERPAKGNQPARFKVGVEFLDLPSDDVFFLSEYVVKEGAVSRRAATVVVDDTPPATPRTKGPKKVAAKKAAAKKAAKKAPPRALKKKKKAAKPTKKTSKKVSKKKSKSVRKSVRRRAR